MKTKLYTGFKRLVVEFAYTLISLFWVLWLCVSISVLSYYWITLMRDLDPIIIVIGTPLVAIAISFISYIPVDILYFRSKNPYK